MESLEISVGSRIREIRVGKAFTQAQLAEITEISSDFISRVERGKNIPSLKYILLISKRMGYHLKDFFDSSVFD
jgi:transcriptional regulator with XRE-family HTH domain